MSYDIHMSCKCCGQTLNASEHFQEGGTQVIGGTNECWLNITYNYSKYYYGTINKDDGIRWIYDKTGKECLPVLEKAIAKLGNEVDDNYWNATEGNAKNPLERLAKWCKEFPDGVFRGD